MPDRTIAVVGATSFLGRELLRSLRSRGIAVTALVRSAPELLQENDFHTVSLHDPQVGRGFDVVVNLAYPSSGHPYTYPRQNTEIFKLVEGVMRDGGQLIHVSTEAVFGLALDKPVRAAPVRPRRDDPYIEAKVDAERHFERKQRGSRWAMDIVRLGNLWGPGSPAWSVRLVGRLLMGQPVGVRGHDGFSNATDVTNAASYLAFLLSSGEQPAGVRYHHVAEFSSVGWSEWIEPVATALGVEPKLADPGVLSQAIRLSSVWGPRAVYRQLAGTRVGGSWVRTGLRLLPDGLRTRLKGPDVVTEPISEPDYSEHVYLSVMSVQREFQSVVDAAWHAPVSRKESVDRFLHWLRPEDIKARNPV